MFFFLLKTQRVKAKLLHPKKLNEFKKRIIKTKQTHSKLEMIFFPFL